MHRSSLRLVLGFVGLLALLPSPAALAQEASPSTAGEAPAAIAPGDKGMATLTIFLRHDESQTLDGINERLRRQNFYDSFPPKGVEVLSWYVMMGIGQVVTLRFPSERLREINRAIEKTAWGGYRTEFYPTYDYRPTAETERKGMASEFH